VLVVEDEPIFAAWLGETLSGEGCTVRVAATGEAALEAIGLGRPAAVLLDLSLPGTLDGWDLLAVLRSRPDTADLPVVVISGREERVRGVALGVAEYFVKPVSRERLLSSLRNLELSPGNGVLIVEDEPTTRELVQRILEGMGLSVRAVGTGEQALALLEADPEAFGLMVLDLALPGIDGFAVLEAVQRRPATRELPVVIFTARDLARTAKQHLAQRVTEVVRKGSGVPISDAVARALRPKRAAASARHDNLPVAR
jgi:CheY-like chemotaxis protein